MKKVKDKSLLFIQGNYLRELRKRYTELSQEQVGKSVGMSKQWLSDIENGKNDIFFTDMVKVIELYGVDVDKAVKELRRRMFEQK